LLFCDEKKGRRIKRREGGEKSEERRRRGRGGGGRSKGRGIDGPKLSGQYFRLIK